MEKEPKETLLHRLDREDVLVRNANIDTAVLAEHDRLVQELKRAGVGLKRPTRRHRLEHPLAAIGCGLATGRNECLTAEETVAAIGERPSYAVGCGCGSHRKR